MLTSETKRRVDACRDIFRNAFLKFRDGCIPLPPLEGQRHLEAETAQMEAVRALLPRFRAKIQRVLDRVWGSA